MRTSGAELRGGAELTAMLRTIRRVHCNKGKYRVGCIIGILRRLQGCEYAGVQSGVVMTGLLTLPPPPSPPRPGSYTSTFEEFARFAGTKAVDEEVSPYAPP